MKKPQYIVHPGDLPRERQIDICGQCHSGDFSLIGEPFSCRPGDRLVESHRLRNPEFKGVGGVHTSNQLTRLAMSECFRQSEMTCTTCHNPHENQRGQTNLFTSKCLECHQPQHCGMADQLGDRIADNCVDCHMPTGDDEGMTLAIRGGTFTVSMIDHHIRVDRRATERYQSRTSH